MSQWNQVFESHFDHDRKLSPVHVYVFFSNINLKTLGILLAELDSENHVGRSASHGAGLDASGWIAIESFAVLSSFVNLCGHTDWESGRLQLHNSSLPKLLNSGHQGVFEILSMLSFNWGLQGLQALILHDVRSCSRCCCVRGKDSLQPSQSMWSANV